MNNGSNWSKPGPKPANNRNTTNAKLLKTTPSPPEYFPEAAKTIHEMLCIDLITRGVLFDADAPLVEALAMALFQLDEVNRLIVEKGVLIVNKNKDLQRNPATLERGKLVEEVTKLSKLMGLGAYGRDKIADGPAAVVDPVEEIRDDLSLDLDFQIALENRDMKKITEIWRSVGGDGLDLFQRGKIEELQAAFNVKPRENGETDSVKVL